MIDILIKVLLITFLWLGIGHLVFKAMHDQFHKPTVWWYILWPLIVVFYLLGSLVAWIASICLFAMYILTRPFEYILDKTWKCEDVDFEEEGEVDA